MFGFGHCLTISHYITAGFCAEKCVFTAVLANSVASLQQVGALVEFQDLGEYVRKIHSRTKFWAYHPKTPEG